MSAPSVVTDNHACIAAPLGDPIQFAIDPFAGQQAVDWRAGHEVE